MSEEYKEFSFARSERVNLPSVIVGKPNIQGVVVAITSFVGREPQYDVEYLLSDTTGPDGHLVIEQCSVAQSVLQTAQPGRGELSIGVKVDTSSLDDALGKARELNGIVKRVSRQPAKRRQKAARSTRSRKRR